MKKWLSNLFYFVVTIVVTYVSHWIPRFYLSGMRFTAADRSPTGDIDLGAKLVFSLGIPVFYFICLTLFFFFYRSVMEQFGIELNKLLLICFNIFIALYLLVRFTIWTFN